MSYCTAGLFFSFFLFMSLRSLWDGMVILHPLAAGYLPLEAFVYPLSSFPDVLLFGFSSSATQFRKVFNSSPVCPLWVLKHVL